MKIAIGIATAGRKEVLSSCMGYLAGQTRLPDEIIVCPSRPEDIADDIAGNGRLRIRIVSGAVGLPHQRNAIIGTTEADVLLFLDDDFLPCPDYFEKLEALFARHLDVVVATGSVLADGILGPGIEFENARAIIEAAEPAGEELLADTYNAYGCNMAVRLQPVKQAGILFDEDLPLYAWLEDVDFCRRLASYGRIVRSNQLRGVHLGTKRSGRSPGRRLGYSQIANPIYLARKGSMSWRKSFRHMVPNLIANLVKSLKPEPWVDRKGRLIGNLLALGDLIRGRMRPDRILSIR